MTSEIESDLTDILKDPIKRRTVRSGMKILQAIKHLMENYQESNPRNITLVYYKNETINISDADKSMFVKKRRSIISRKLSELQDIRLVMPMEGTERTDGRSIPYHLTLSGIELLENEDLYLSVMEDRFFPNDNPEINDPDGDMEFRRKYHSDRIRALLKKIKDEISKVFDRDFFPDEINPAIIRFKVNNLSFENDTLFDDLRNHIGTFLKSEDLEIKLEEMRVSVNNFLDLDEKVRRIIISELSRELGMAYAEHHDRIDSFGPNLVDWVIRNLYYLSFGDDSLYKRYTQKLKSEKERIMVGNEKVKQIRLDGAVIMVLPLNKKESHYLRKISELMGSIKDTPILKHYSVIRSEKQVAEDMQKELIKSLEKEIEIPIYPGICPYIESR